MPHGNWGSAGACSVFMVKRTLRRSVLQERSWAESLWVWQLHFLLCAATWKENLLCLLMFILILHVFTTHRRKWQIEKIFVFTKAKRLLQQAARQTQCKCQSLSFSILCAMHMIIFTCLKSNRKFRPYAAIINAVSLHKDYLLHPTAGFWNTTQKGGWNHQPHFIWPRQLNLNKLKNDLPVTLWGIQQKITLK